MAWIDPIPFDPGLVAALDAMGLAEAFRPTGVVIAIVIVLSGLLGAFGAAVSYETINPVTNEIEIATTGTLYFLISGWVMLTSAMSSSSMSRSFRSP